MLINSQINRFIFKWCQSSLVLLKKKKKKLLTVTHPHHHHTMRPDATELSEGESTSNRIRLSPISYRWDWRIGGDAEASAGVCVFCISDVDNTSCGGLLHPSHPIPHAVFSSTATGHLPGQFQQQRSHKNYADILDMSMTYFEALQKPADLAFFLQHRPIACVRLWHTIYM